MIHHHVGEWIRGLGGGAPLMSHGAVHRELTAALHAVYPAWAPVGQQWGTRHTEGSPDQPTLAFYPAFYRC